MEAPLNIKGKPFDFWKWRDWLRIKAEELNGAGFKAKFGFNDIGSKRSSGISVENQARGGYFSNWVTGETDFEVRDSKSLQPVVEKMGLMLDDSNFANAFDEFQNYLKGKQPPRVQPS